MNPSTRPPDRIHIVPGPRGKPWIVHVYDGDVPWEIGWPRVENALVRLMLPKVKEILARDGAVRPMQPAPPQAEGAVR